jgi:hypothetical protein
VFFEFLEQEIEDYQDDYNKLITAIPELGQQYTYNDYARARVIYASRSFTLNETEGLAPIADMMNTDRRGKQNVQWEYTKQYTTDD